MFANAQLLCCDDVSQITLQRFIDHVYHMRDWGNRTDYRVAIEMAYTFGFAQARMTIGGYVEMRDVEETIVECSRIFDLIATGCPVDETDENVAAQVVRGLREMGKSNNTNPA